MKKIIISPYSRKLRNGKENPKNYPFWNELLSLLKNEGFYIIQIGRTGEVKLEKSDELLLDKSLNDLKKLISESDIWISVDNFLPHLCHLIPKPGIVLFGQSDPLIFGHKENINLLKDRKYLREKQFDIWECCECNNDAFVEPSVVLDFVCKRRQL